MRRDKPKSDYPAPKGGADDTLLHDCTERFDRRRLARLNWIMETSCMPDNASEEIVAAVMKPSLDVEIPTQLRASIDRQSQSLMNLASSLIQSGMEAESVRTVIERAHASYQDELISVILELRERHEP